MSMKKPQLGMSARKTVGNTVYHIFMVTLSVIMIYPFVWSLLSSFKSSEQLYGGNPLDLWPRPFTMENYERLFQVLPFDKFTVNSVFVRRDASLYDRGRLSHGICAHAAGVPRQEHFVSCVHRHDDDPQPRHPHPQL